MKSKASQSFFPVAVLAVTVYFSLSNTAAWAGEGDATWPPEPGSGTDLRVSELLGASEHLGVDWKSLYWKHGYERPRSRPDFVDLHGGIEAFVLEDNVSAGVAVDMSAYAGAAALADSFVYNGTVAPEHDLGNAYVYATLDASENLVVFVGVERLVRTADSYIEIELNQDRVGVAGGVPWPIRGRRTEGDLLIRADILRGAVSSVEVLRWRSGAFESLAFYDGLAASNCNGETGVVLFCGTDPRVGATQELWDVRGGPVAPVPSDRLFEVGVNVGRLLERFLEYSAVQVRTPEDIVLGAFRTMGYWARR